MATHSSDLAWRIPGMGEPGGLSSMGLHRIRHDLAAVHVCTVLILESVDIKKPKYPYLLYDSNFLNYLSDQSCIY